MGAPRREVHTFASAFLQRLRRVRAQQRKLTFEQLGPRYYDDPEGFAREVLGVENLWSKQLEMLLAVRDYDRVTIRASQKSSKTHSAAILILWWFCTRVEARCIFTAPTWRQTQNVLYRQILQLIQTAGRLHPGLFDSVRVAALCDTGVQSKDFRSINGFVSHDTGGMQGISGQNMLVVIDEASHVSQSVYDSHEGNLAAGGKLLAISNPLLNFGWFYDSHHKNKAYWHTIHISATDSPNYIEKCQVILGLASYVTVERRRAEWGEDSSNFQIRVLGNFSTREENRMFPLARILDAIARWDETPADGPLRIGVDPAGASERGDESAFCAVRGNKMLRLEAYRSLDEDAIVRKIADWCADAKQQTGATPHVTVDREGKIGAELIGALMAYVKLNRGVFTLSGVRANEKAIREPKTYGTLRDELAANVELWLKQGGTLIDDEKLIEDLTVLEWEVDIRGRNKLLHKDKVRKILYRSPDRFDALALALWSDGIGEARASMQQQLARRGSTGAARPSGSAQSGRGYWAKR
jgi:phage terminase large subunit